LSAFFQRDVCADFKSRFVKSSGLHYAAIGQHFAFFARPAQSVVCQGLVGTG